MFEEGKSYLRDTRVELLLIFVITLEEEEPFFVKLDDVLLPCKLYEARPFVAMLFSFLFVILSFYERFFIFAVC